jgi:galactokinase
MSSSSALMVATFFLLSGLNDLPARPEFAAEVHSVEDLAGYLGTIENGQSFGQLVGDSGVGTFGGSEDHTAILCAEPNRLGQFAYCPVRHERTIIMPRDHLFVIAASGVRAQKTGAAMGQYNRASARAAVATRLWCRATGRRDPHLAAAVASATDARQRLLALVRDSDETPFGPQELAARVAHFLAESEEIIPAVPERLEGANLAVLGTLSERSQRLADKLLGSQTPETNYLAAAARDLGAVAASAFGGGFGGSVWALVRTDEVDAFARRWAAAYARAHPAPARQATYFSSRAGPAALMGAGREWQTAGPATVRASLR